MRTELFDFELPDALIALHPATPRDAARLLVVRPNAGLSHRHVYDLPALLDPGDALVVNDTRVIMAELEGTRTRADGAVARIHVNLLQRLDGSRWLALARPAKRLKLGDRVRFGVEGAGEVCLLGTLDATVAAKGEGGEVELAFDLMDSFLDEAIAIAGQVPLPPYIAGKRAVEDRDRTDYQTMFAVCEGAVAAPTAGLHFTPQLLGLLNKRGIVQHPVRLHVGAGTFMPVKAEDTTDHQMHAEWGEVTEATADALNAVRAQGGRIVAIGTTSLRLLEQAAGEDGIIRPFRGETAIFITPGYRFKAVDVLMTNFHLPRSTLFMLVSAFAGLETMQAAYAQAIGEGYRFYSYGDASLLFPAEVGGKS